MNSGSPLDPVVVKEGCHFGHLNRESPASLGGQRLAMPGDKGYTCIRVSGVYLAKRGSNNISFLFLSNLENHRSSVFLQMAGSLVLALGLGLHLMILTVVGCY